MVAVLLACVIVGHALGQVSITEDSAARVTLENQYVRVSFNKVHPGIDVMQGDFMGHGAYGTNTAAVDRPDDHRLHRSGIVLERIGMPIDQDIWYVPSSSSRCADEASLNSTVTLNTTDVVELHISGVVDDCSEEDAALTSSWTIRLARGSRAFSLAVDASATREVDVAAVSVSVYLGDPVAVGSPGSPAGLPTVFFRPRREPPNPPTRTAHARPLAAGC